MRVGPASSCLTVVFATGCILFVPDRDGGDQCRFRGETTACGACMRQRCGAVVDLACTDPAQEGALALMEECAERGDDACTRIPASKIGDCLAAQCKSLCYPKSGRSVTRCTESFLGAGLACSCELNESAANEVACSTALYPRARCCAPKAWPAAALECDCFATACVPNSTGCICTLTDNLDATTAQSCTGQYCCAVEDRCQCRDRPCQAGEKAVPACSRDALTCGANLVEVESCSIRR